jgi:hypothetical protein
MTTPGAIRIKETLVQWRYVKVITAQLPNPHLLRRDSVFTADEAGMPASPATQLRLR